MNGLDYGFSGGSGSSRRINRFDRNTVGRVLRPHMMDESGGGGGEERRGERRILCQHLNIDIITVLILISISIVYIASIKVPFFCLMVLLHSPLAAFTPGRDPQTLQELWGLNEDNGEDADYEEDEDDDEDNVAANSKFRSERAEQNERVKSMRAGTGNFTAIKFCIVLLLYGFYGCFYLWIFHAHICI
jgi:hypothetical protein